MNTSVQYQDQFKHRDNHCNQLLKNIDELLKSKKFPISIVTNLFIYLGNKQHTTESLQKMAEKIQRLQVELHSWPAMHDQCKIHLSIYLRLLDYQLMQLAKQLKGEQKAVSQPFPNFETITNFLALDEAAVPLLLRVVLDWYKQLPPSTEAITIKEVIEDFLAQDAHDQYQHSQSFIAELDQLSAELLEKHLNDKQASKIVKGFYYFQANTNTLLRPSCS